MPRNHPVRERAVFKTIGHTFALMRMSWNVLMLDRELIAFPILSLIGIVVLSIPFAPLVLAGGDSGAPAIAGIVYLVLVYTVTVFFSAALVASALHRLRGGDPNVRDGLTHALRHVHHLFVWALISAVMTSLLMALRAAEKRIPFARLIANVIGGIWGFLTFFVVPVMVSENHGPISGIKRSVSIIQTTWGRQITASFGFFLFYLGAALVAFVPALLIGLLSPPVGIVVGILLLGVGTMVVQTLEGIFKAALYDFAVGGQPAVFNLPTLQNAFGPAPA